MRRALLAIVLVAFVAAGAAQPVNPNQTAGNQSGEDVDKPENESEDEEVEDEEAGEIENESGSPEAPLESAQFDARLMTAISTVEDLKMIAPSQEVRQELDSVLQTLRDIQERTDTASLDNDENESETGRRGPPENRGPSNPGPGQGQDQRSRQANESGERGPSENSNRPGFVNRMLKGLFG